MTPNELSELTPLAEQLNKKTDEVNKLIADFNAKLAAMNIGLEVWPDQGLCVHGRNSYQIGYAKVDDKWVLAVCDCEAKYIDVDSNGFAADYWDVVEGSEGDVQSVLNASRKIRLETLELLPSILAALRRETENSLETIEEAKKLASTI